MQNVITWSIKAKEPQPTWKGGATQQVEGRQWLAPTSPSLLTAMTAASLLPATSACALVPWAPNELTPSSSARSGCALAAGEGPPRAMDTAWPLSAPWAWGFRWRRLTAGGMAACWTSSAASMRPATPAPDSW